MRAIQSELNPRVLEVKLKSFLTPAARQGQLVSLARIKERFQIDDRVEDAPAMPTPEEIGVAL